MNRNIQKYAEKWNVILEREIKTLSGTVCLGKQGNLPVVLKLPRPDSDEVQQKEMLRHFNGSGAIRVIDSDGHVVLLERLNPGRHLIELAKAGRDDEATRIFCQIARLLHSARGSLENFRPVAELASGFDRYLASGDTGIPAQEVRQARELYLSMTASQAAPVLLHGDLHHDNILHDDVRGWIAIDPKGYVGEPAYEAGAWLRNPMQNIHAFASREMIERRAAVMVEELGWNRGRILEWSYAQAILSAVWSIEDKENPDAPLTIAKILRKMI